MRKLYIKIITGFRSDQFCTINADEAHKAYFLFSNPEARTVFANGVALVGRNIQGIEPDYNATMGWNPTHKLGGDDMNELREKRIDSQLRDVLFTAKETAKLAQEKPELLNSPMVPLPAIEVSSHAKEFLANKLK